MILLTVKFRWIQFSGCREEVENVSANQNLGRPSWFSDWPEKLNIAEDVEFLLPVQCRQIPFSRFRGRDGNLVFPIGPKKCYRGRWVLACCQVSSNSLLSFQNSNVVEDVGSLLSVNFSQIPCCGFRGKVENGKTNWRPGSHLGFWSPPPKKIQNW